MLERFGVKFKEVNELGSRLAVELIERRKELGGEDIGYGHDWSVGGER